MSDRMNERADELMMNLIMEWMFEWLRVTDDCFLLNLNVIEHLCSALSDESILTVQDFQSEEVCCCTGSQAVHHQSIRFVGGEVELDGAATWRVRTPVRQTDERLLGPEADRHERQSSIFALPIGQGPTVWLYQTAVHSRQINQIQHDVVCAV